MGNSSSQNAGGNVRPHGKRMTPAEKRAKQQAAGLPPVGAAVPSAPTSAPASRAGNAPPPAPAAAPAPSANGQRRANPQSRERKPFKELVRVLWPQAGGVRERDRLIRDDILTTSFLVLLFVCGWRVQITGELREVNDYYEIEHKELGHGAGGLVTRRGWLGAGR